MVGYILRDPNIAEQYMTIKRHYFYCINNIVNNKNYIGQSKRPMKRWQSHQEAASSNTPRMMIRQKIKQYGVENFTFKIITSSVMACTCVPGKAGPCQAAANEEETALIKQWESHISTGKGYNIAKIGGAFPAQQTKGIHNSPKTEFKKGHKGISNGGSFKSGMIPWNKSNNPRKPTGTNPRRIIMWPTDDELIAIVNNKGLTATADNLDITVAAVSNRMMRRGLKHNRKPGNAKTTFVAGSKHKIAKLTEK